MHGGGLDANGSIAGVGHFINHGFILPQTSEGLHMELPGSRGQVHQNVPPHLGAEPASTSPTPAQAAAAAPPSRYESQKRRDWNTFGQYLRNHRPPLALAKCSGAHVLEFLRYLDQFGKTKVHAQGCPFFGHPQPPAACGCPLRQAWGSLDALIGRLRAAFEENGGKPESNPFGTRAVRLYLREVRENQAKARGIAYEKKKRKRPPGQTAATATATASASSSSSTATTITAAAPTLIPSDHTSYHHHHLQQAAGPSSAHMIPSFN